MGPPPSMYANNVTIFVADRPLVGATGSESVLIDCNCTRPGDGTTPAGQLEANPNDSVPYVLAMDPVATIHNIETHLWRLRTERTTTDGSVGVT